MTGDRASFTRAASSRLGSTRAALVAPVLMALLVLGLPGCAGLGVGRLPGVPEPAVLDAEPFPGPVEGGGVLRILAWPGYVEDGSTRPDVDWVSEFEQDTGCDVQAETFLTSDEGVQRFVAEDVDVLLMSGDSVLRLVYGNVVAPLNLDLIAGLADLAPGLLGAPYNSVNGVPYGLPSGRSAMLLLTREGYEGRADSWQPLWQPPAALRGRIGVYDSPMTIADAALYLMGTAPELGIVNPYALDDRQFTAALGLLTEQADSVGLYWRDYLPLAEQVVEGEIELAMAIRGTARITGTEGVSTRFTLPATGTTGWSDSWLVRNAAPNPGCAYLWLNWVSTPQVNGEIAAWVGDAPANLAACDRAEFREHCWAYRARDERFWSRVRYYTTPLADCVDGRTGVTCVPYARWASAWAEFRAPG